VQNAQLLRLQRFGMALITYLIVLLATLLVTILGLGEMNAVQWAAFIGLGMFGNTVFFILFYTNINLRFSDPSLTREQIVYSAFWGLMPLYSLPEARPIVLMFYLPAFSFGMLKLTRRQFFFVAAAVMGFYASILTLEYFQNRQGFMIKYELFLFLIFGILLTWFVFFGGFASNLRRRLQKRNELVERANEKIKIEIDEHKRTQKEKDDLIVELKDALSKVKILSGLLPICSACKKIRDDSGYWGQIESFISKNSEAVFSHSICPDCRKKLYPELYKDKDNQSEP
jgi:hypothetical protein